MAFLYSKLFTRKGRRGAGAGMEGICFPNRALGPLSSMCRLLEKASGQHFWGLPRSLSSKESTCDAGDVSSIAGLGRSPGERNSNPLQYSSLGDPMDRGA